MCTTPRGSIPSRLRSNARWWIAHSGEAVDDGGDALWIDVGHDVGGLDERALTQRADRAAVAVGAHHVELEALLVEPDPRVAGGVGADVWG
jgi:hypothetical protein